MSKISNILTMIQLLNTGKTYSIQALANELEVSTRMIRVYKNDLEMAGIYIESKRGPYGGYKINREVNINKNLAFNLPKEISSLYNTLSEAIKEKRKCYIEYQSNNIFTERIVLPFQLIVVDKQWLLIALCEKKKELRTFKLERIIVIKLI